METLNNCDIYSLIKDNEKTLAVSGIANAKLQIELLLMDLLGVDRIQLYTDTVFTKKIEHNFNKMVAKRLQRIPVQYITGKTNFFELEFLTPRGIFIPRPETEILVESALKALSGKEQCQILDLCTGAGIIAIALAKHTKDCHITALDISSNSVKTARENARMNAVIDKITFLVRDLFNSLENLKFDMIVSNPPYIRNSDLDFLPVEVKHEPMIALDGGRDGLKFYRKIFKTAHEFLKTGGFLLVEVGDDQAGAVGGIARSSCNFRDIEIIKDLNGMGRVLKTRCRAYNG